MERSKKGMAGGYSVLNALNRSTRQQAEEKPGGRFRTKDISITDIYPNGNNFYAMQDIEALAEDIKTVGLLENLTVMYAPHEGKNYKLLGGERRWRALCLLVKKGYNEFSAATCQIRSAENERAEMIEIIMCNRQRVKTVWEQIEEEKRLKETLQEMKKNKETLKGYDLQDGRLRDTIAAILNYSAAKVGQMETIARNLTGELQEALKDEKINFSTAYTVAKMDEAGQQAALKAYKETGSLNSAQAKEAARSELEVRPGYGAEQMSVESICYHCTHWDDCHEKSETTVKCATFEDKNKKPTEVKKEKEVQPEGQQARIIDSSTGEVYKNMYEAEKATKSNAEPRRIPEPAAGQQAKERRHYIRLAAACYDDVKAGIKTFELRKKDRDYKTGDILEMGEFADGRNTGRVICCRVTYILEEYTGLMDGYCILGIQVLKEA